LGLAGRYEKAADESLVIFEDVETISGRMSVFESRESPQSMGIDELAYQFDGRLVIPVQLGLPMMGFLVKEVLERARVHLAEIDDLHRRRAALPGILL
jgi:hypothetical protein